MACDVVLNGITGSTGLAATLAALAGRAVLALANKESLVVGGRWSPRRGAGPDRRGGLRALRAGPVPAGRPADEVDRLVLTASGGPFRGRSREEMADVTPAQALAHPTWSMGRVITTNSATLVNKGLELLEAHLLYGVDLDRIDVVVHPQSIVHSMVQFVDGSTLAQCSPPDMRLPIALGLSWPERLPGAARPATGPPRQLDVRAAGPRGVPRGRAGPAGRPVGRHRARGLQRGQRGMRGRLPRRPDRLPRHRRHGRRGAGEHVARTRHVEPARRRRLGAGRRTTS